MSRKLGLVHDFQATLEPIRHLQDIVHSDDLFRLDLAASHLLPAVVLVHLLHDQLLPGLAILLLLQDVGGDARIREGKRQTGGRRALACLDLSLVTLEGCIPQVLYWLIDSVDVHDSQDPICECHQPVLFCIIQRAIEETFFNHPEAYQVCGRHNGRSNGRHDVKRLDTLTWHSAAQEGYDLNRMLLGVAAILQVLLHDLEDIVCSCAAPNETLGGEP